MSETIEQKCLAKGVKLTDQRKIIAQVMSESTDHPDVDELYNRVSKIDTIYSSLPTTLSFSALMLFGILCPRVIFYILDCLGYSTMGF